MNPLKPLLKGLTKRDAQNFRKFLTCFSKWKDPESNKSVRLFDQIYLSRELKDKIPKDQKHDRLRKLTLSLRDRIGEFLLLDINLRRKGRFREKDVAYITTKKKLAFAYFLSFELNDHYSANKLLKEVIQLSEKYEFYQNLVECYQRLRRNHGLRNDQRTFDRYGELIDHYRCCDQATENARDLYLQHVIHIGFQGRNNRKNFLCSLRQHFKELEKDYKRTGSAIVKYYRTIFEFWICILDGAYENGSEIIRSLMDQIRHNPSVYRRERIGIAYDHLGELELYKGNYLQAVSYFYSAQKHIPKESVNFRLSREGEFYGRFWNGDYKEAQLLLDYLLNDLPDDEQKFRRSKYQYLESCLLFQIGLYRKALGKLLQIKDLLEDKQGYNNTTRILSIMCYLEMEDHMAAGNQIEGFRKHFSRISKTHQLANRRDEEILSILTTLKRNNYDFGATYLAQLVRIERLGSDQEDYRWLCSKAELIPFHGWFEKKVFSNNRVTLIRERIKIRQ